MHQRRIAASQARVKALEEQEVATRCVLLYASAPFVRCDVGGVTVT
jgi:hypothetical protein